MSKVRYAKVIGGHSVKLETVRAYLPSNYRAYEDPFSKEILINGVDDHGWTLEDYVIPRLASGLIHAEPWDPGDDTVKPTEQ